MNHLHALLPVVKDGIVLIVTIMRQELSLQPDTVIQAR